MQELCDIYLDCDADTLLAKVNQVGGAACHKGYRSCFFRRIDDNELKIVADRIFDPDKVYKNNP